MDAVNRKTIMIDRTLPEIQSSLLRMSRFDILDLCWMLMNIGADFVETDTELLNRLGKLPEGLAFILRADSVSELEACEKFRIKRCIIQCSLLEQPEVPELIKRAGLYAILEVKANSIKGIRRLEKLKALRNFEIVNCIRVTGLGRVDTPEWLETIHDLKRVWKKEIDICPHNRFFMGNAIALEAAVDGVESITATLSGFGRRHSYASLEVVLSAMKLHKTGTKKMNPDVLMLLYEQFTKCSHIKPGKHKSGSIIQSFNERDILNPDRLISVREMTDA